MNVLGVDLGGTFIRVGKVGPVGLGQITRAQVPAGESAGVVLAALTALVDPLAGGVDAIGIGVPSLVDPARGIVRAVPNIPSWRDVELTKLLEARYGKPVHVLNDASCFVLGEHRHGAARNRADVVGVTLGTGTGAGIICDHRLVVGHNGGAGELGMLPYLDRDFERYTSGAFFREVHGTSGEAAFAAAQRGDDGARAVLAELGRHLGKLCVAIVCTIDPEMIVLGGSISRAWPFFHEAMFETLRAFPYPASIAGLTVVQHALEDPGVVGAAVFARDRVTVAK